MATKIEQALVDYPRQRAAAARQPGSVDQSDRRVPFKLRQSGPTPVEMLISTRVRKSPYWHLAFEAGCWRATVYNRMYHPRGYVRPEEGGAMVEYDMRPSKNGMTDTRASFLKPCFCLAATTRPARKYAAAERPGY